MSGIVITLLFVFFSIIKLIDAKELSYFESEKTYFNGGVMQTVSIICFSSLYF